MDRAISDTKPICHVSGTDVAALFSRLAQAPS
ncbi:hypothetical protein IEO21_08742 [Rhodonia placenta]|uniref:Uncharacterized protein n=1 Tax=Rhodonia placenta TaxID=104341 RepID=A0A8H7NVW8_9APHY|nr:hypothetical protein IEO21_08742 [Postia placenta]